MGNRVTFGVGVGETAERRAMNPLEVDRMIADSIQYLTTVFGGVFVTRGTGGWMDGGLLISESGLLFTCLVERRVASSSVLMTANYLKLRFRQKAVLVTVEEVGQVEYV